MARPSPFRQLIEKALTFSLYVLPHHLISRGLFTFSRLEQPNIARLSIAAYTRLFSLNMAEAQQSDPQQYASLNKLFTRAIRPEVRPIEGDERTLVSPADGVLSEIGRIESGQLVQAKGHLYSLEALFAGRQDLVERFRNGSFATVYLSPRDYHRVHMPITGRLREMLYVPGRLFSVSLMTTRHIPNIFARNERVIGLFESDHGMVAQVLVGAINVAAIETTWAGLVTPPAGKQLRSDSYDGSLSIARGEEMGRFNMGSTVVVLTERPLQIDRYAELGSPIRLGEALGVMGPAATVEA